MKRMVELKHKSFYLYLAQAEAEQDKVKKEALLRKSLKLNPEYIEAHISLARMREAPWDTIALKSLLERYPKSSEIHT